MSGPRPTPRPRGSRRDGFTLIEVLVAFTVLAIVTLAIQRGVMAATSSTARADNRLGAEIVARTLLTAPLGAGRDAASPRSGTMDGFDWTLRFEPVQLPMAAIHITDGKPPAWMPLKMIITVSSKSRQELKIETIRLVGASSS